MPLGCFLFTIPLLRQTTREQSSPVLANSVLYALLLQLFITRHFILERLSIYPAMFTLLALPAAAQAPWFNYTAPDGTPHVVWFEDARSMSAKLLLIREYGLYGAGYWNLMRPYPQGWAVLNALYETANG